jgi:hypothetical protein
MEQKPLWHVLADEVNIATMKALNDQKRARRDANIEVEIQFGTYLEPDPNKDEKFGRFISTVSPSAFYRVMAGMKRLTSTYKFTETEDEIMKSERVSYNPKTKETEYLEKIRIYSSYDIFYSQTQRGFVNQSSSAGNTLAQDYNMKITVANEYSYTSESKNFRPITQRTKKRTSFDFRYQYGGYLDLTIVEEKNLEKGDESKTKYEVEFEITESFDKFKNQIQKLTVIIMSLLQDTVIPYTNTQKNEMYQYVGDLLDIDYRKMKFALLPEARDLRLSDMVYGGVVGNSNTPYCVTHKADGIRKLIVTTNDSIWAFVPGTQDANLIYKFVQTGENTIPPFQEGFIFDGELITKESRNRKDDNPCRYMFYIFDCLVENKQDIRNKNYMERMELALKFTEYPMIEIKTIFVEEGQPLVKFREFQINDTTINRTIKFVVKGFLSLVSVEHFFETMRLMFLQQDDLMFKQDGFMFIPLNTVYNPYDQTVPVPMVYKDQMMYRNAPPIFKRGLINYPDICKWKPVELRSIDFIVEKKGNQIILKALDGNTLRVFEGTKNFPLDERIDGKHSLIQNLPQNTIVEFYWDAKKQLLTPSRLRTDKPAPNKLQTAKIVWNNIFKGIDQETLIGESFQLMRKYHNKIKSKLFRESQTSRNNKVLLDIGSGRGGDINKWRSFDLIFAVEPNKDHQKDLITRLKNSKLDENKVILIPTGGEDYQTITDTIQKRYGEKVSTVSLMLSFSFFYDKIREGLKKTIEDNLERGGDVLVFTIDGDTVEQVFNPTSKEYQEKTLKFLNAQLTYQPKSGILYIDIPGTIVSQQKEKPPSLTQLFAEWQNFLPLHVSRADKESFMNSGEKPFSNMYTSFTWIYLSDVMSNIEIERIVPYAKNENVEDWTLVPNGLYGISVFPSDYFFLSAVVKALDPVYQNNNDLNFRRNYVIDVWNEIQQKLPPTQKQIYNLPWNHNVLQVFANAFQLSIMYIKDKKAYRYISPDPKHKIVIVESYLIGKMNASRLIQSLF